MSEKDKRISLDKAIEWTGMWRDQESEYNKYNECNAFLVPLQDLQDLVAEMGDQGPDAKVRCYLGVESKPAVPAGETHFEEKLILVGTKRCVDKAGNVTYVDLIDGYNPQCGDATGMAEDDIGGGGIWDFSTPCPPDCDPNSPLN